MHNDAAAKAWGNLQKQDRDLLIKMSCLAGKNARLALVGGAVRDALYGQTPLDIDISAEGADIEQLAGATGFLYVFHSGFQNATLSLPDGRYLDLVRSRSETYPIAGKNPVVAEGSLEEDLLRRDFGVNALALEIPTDSGPKLIDLVGGLGDLEKKILRPLHAKSFFEDASRLVRGARLAARLSLSASPEHLRQVPDALVMADKTPRLWAELRLLLQEKRPYLAAKLLSDWGAAALVPSLEVLEKIDLLGNVSARSYSAGFLAKAAKPQDLAHKLGLEKAALALLERAKSEVFFAKESAEVQLRQILKPTYYTPLTGKDVLAMRQLTGKEVGKALQHLAKLRHNNELQNQEDEQNALALYLDNKG